MATRQLPVIRFPASSTLIIFSRARTRRTLIIRFHAGTLIIWIPAKSLGTSCFIIWFDARTVGTRPSRSVGTRPRQTLPPPVLLPRCLSLLLFSSTTLHRTLHSSSNALLHPLSWFPTSPRPSILSAFACFRYPVSFSSLSVNHHQRRYLQQNKTLLVFYL